MLTLINKYIYNGSSHKNYYNLKRFYSATSFCRIKVTWSDLIRQHLSPLKKKMYNLEMISSTELDLIEFKVNQLNEMLDEYFKMGLISAKQYHLLRSKNLSISISGSKFKYLGKENTNKNLKKKDFQLYLDEIETAQILLIRKLIFCQKPHKIKSQLELISNYEKEKRESIINETSPNNFSNTIIAEDANLQEEASSNITRTLIQGGASSGIINATNQEVEQSPILISRVSLPLPEILSTNIEISEKNTFQNMLNEIPVEISTEIPNKIPNKIPDKIPQNDSSFLIYLKNKLNVFYMSYFSNFFIDWSFFIMPISIIFFTEFAYFFNILFENFFIEQCFIKNDCLIHNLNNATPNLETHEFKENKLKNPLHNFKDDYMLQVFFGIASAITVVLWIYRR